MRSSPLRQALSDPTSAEEVVAGYQLIAEASCHAARLLIPDTNRDNDRRRLAYFLRIWHLKSPHVDALDRFNYRSVHSEHPFLTSLAYLRNAPASDRLSRAMQVASLVINATLVGDGFSLTKTQRAELLVEAAEAQCGEELWLLPR